MRIHENLNPFYLENDTLYAANGGFEKASLYKRWVDSSLLTKIKCMFSIIKGNTDPFTPFELDTMKAGIFDYLTLFIGIGVSAGYWYINNNNGYLAPKTIFMNFLVNGLARYVVASALTLTLAIPVAVFVHLPAITVKSIWQLISNLKGKVKENSIDNTHEPTHRIVNEKLEVFSKIKIDINDKKLSNDSIRNVSTTQINVVNRTSSDVPSGKKEYKSTFKREPDVTIEKNRVTRNKYRGR